MEGEGGEKDEEKDAKKRRLSAMIIKKIETDDIKWQHRGMEDLINKGGDI